MVGACEQSGCNHFPAIDYFTGLQKCLQSEHINPDFEGLFVLDTIANQFIKENEILNLESIGIITGPESGYSAD